MSQILETFNGMACVYLTETLITCFVVGLLCVLAVSFGPPKEKKTKRVLDSHNSDKGRIKLAHWKARNGLVAEIEVPPPLPPSTARSPSRNISPQSSPAQVMVGTPQSRAVSPTTPKTSRVTPTTSPGNSSVAPAAESTRQRANRTPSNANLRDRNLRNHNSEVTPPNEMKSTSVFLHIHETPKSRKGKTVAKNQ